MKKFVAITLAVVMLLVLAAGCQSKPADTPPAAAPPPASSNSGSEPSAGSEPGAVLHEGVGFYTDDVDWFARPAYKFGYISNDWMLIHENVAAALKEWGEHMNYEITTYTSGGDMNNFTATLESYASQGYDGVFVDPDATTAARVIELCDELGLAYMPMINPLVNNDTREYLAPAVTLDAYSMGQWQAEWLIENYKTFWPDAKPEEIGFEFMYVTFNENLFRNMEGARDAYAKAFPELAETNFYAGDIQGYSFDAQGGLEYTSTFIASHPEVKYWWISGCIEALAQGGTRAVEDLNLEDTALVASNGTDFLIQDWDEGYDGAWKGGTYYAYPIFTEPVAAGLIALIEGRATYDTLWGTEYIPAGQKYPVYPTETRFLTKDTYKAYLDEVSKYINSKG